MPKRIVSGKAAFVPALENLQVQGGKFLQEPERSRSSMHFAPPVKTQVLCYHPEPGDETCRSVGLKAQQAAVIVFGQLLADKHETISGLLLFTRRSSDRLIQHCTVLQKEVFPGARSIGRTELSKQLSDCGFFADRTVRCLRRCRWFSQYIAPAHQRRHSGDTIGWPRDRCLNLERQQDFQQPLDCFYITFPGLGEPLLREKPRL